MFAIVIRFSRKVYRALLIAVMAFNAFAPAAVTAMPPLDENEIDPSSVTIRGAAHGSHKSHHLSQRGNGRSGIQAIGSNKTNPSLQDTTPTPESAETPTVTPDATLETVPVSSPTLESTPTPSATQTTIPSTTTATLPPDLSFKLSAVPEQAAPGDEVTFTITIANNGQTPATGLLFSNVLPAQFGNAQNGFKDFDYDPQTRLLTWGGAQAGLPTLAPGQKLSLTYTVRMDAQLDEVQLVDSASLTADGLTVPLAAEAVLILVAPQKRLTLLDARGGKALGLNGNIQVTLPESAQNAPRAVLIQDLSTMSDASTTPTAPSSATAEEPWLKFALEMRVPKPENAQDLRSPVSAGSDASTTPTAPSFAPSVSEGTETDRIIPMEPIEAQFDQPVEIAVSFDGLADLSTLESDKTPFLVTLDEDSGTWVRVPLTSIDRESNRITAEVNHFSTWGAGIGNSFPTNGANILLFDNAYSDLYTGRARYSLPIWTPPGRNGMAPALGLSYSSGTADGVLGDVQAPWVGMGWNIDSVEIARKITNGVCGTGCGSGSYGYENKFLFLFNGTGYELLPDGATAGRYHTKSESFLYIQRHSNSLGNNTPAATNATSEWWEVVQKDGTRWRLGWTGDSEQLSAMKGYPGAATGAWAALGYAGSATDVVTARWRADQVTDTHGNRMTFTYFEETRAVAGTATNYDRASYLDTIAYTGHTSGTPAAGYSVVFVRESRGTGDVPASPAAWDHWDTYRLDRIEAKYGTTVVRTYDLSYQVGSYSDGSASWQTTKLSSVAISGGATTAPTVTFSYVDKDNRAANGGSSNEWPYPRLASVVNGWGGASTFTYSNDGRAYTSWYNWRVEFLDVTDGIAGHSPMRTGYTYNTPCYNDATAGWCNTSYIGELIGYGKTTATSMEFNSSTPLAVETHEFYTNPESWAGREYRLQQKNASGFNLKEVTRSFSTVTAGFPTGVFFTYVRTVSEAWNTPGLLSYTEYMYDQTTGNLTTEKQYDSNLVLYRQTEYQYVINTNPAVWILDTVSRRTVKDGNLTIISEEQYGYNGNLPGVGSPTINEPDLSRVVNGTQTIDTKYIYDSYGNSVEARSFKSYGSTGSQPSGTYISYLTDYDTALETYVVSSDPPLLPATTINYDYGLGLPTAVTDPNGNTTTTAYDGLGRVTSITYPGSAQQNVKYTYPTLPVSAPFGLKVEMWDQTASVYRADWQIMDGLGRVIQTQSPYESAGVLVLTDTSYNALGLPDYQGLPRTYNGTSGTYFPPTWGSVPHTTTSYDIIKRPISISYPDGSSETFSYYGFRTTFIDRNNHKKVQENDGFGRLIKAEEYTGSGTYTLYATTTYGYDARDLLTTVTDAAGNQTTIGYNNYGRKISMNDPDMGVWSYGYDVLGNLTSQTDARNCVTSVTYDDLNRPLTKTYTGPGACNPTPDVTYTYDSAAGGNEGLGRRTGMTDGSGSTTWFYNVLGQVTSETHNIESTNYTISATFDAFSRPLTQTLPNSETLNYSYNAMGALSGLSGTNTYISQIHYEASGQAKDQQLGNGLVQQFCYNANTLRLSKLRVYPGTLQTCGTTPASPRLDLSYTYQNNGNVSQIVDATRSETLTYTYDELDQLDTVSGPYGHNYDYNELGNITSKNTTTYTYGNAAHKHAVTALSTGESYGYDANGNMTTRVEGGITITQTFDAENRLVTLTAGGYTAQFVYDGDGNLVKKINPDGSKTLYVGSVYEVNKSSGGSVTGTKTYYPAGGAMRVNSTLYFVLKDHLGSASVVTDATGAIVGEDRFYPFGETRFTTGTMYTDKLFTGQREITGAGIYHYGARFYSPKLGRFLSADTIVPGAGNPQNLNRYSYVRNNPIRYTDSTGHWIDEGCGCANTGKTKVTAPRVVNGSRVGNSDGKGTFVPVSKKPLDPPNRNPDTSVSGSWDGTCGAGSYSPHCPDWHFYTTTNLVCPAEFECTVSEMKDYLSRYAYPGQDHSFPVKNNGIYSILIVIPNSDYGFSIGNFPGKIRVSVSDDGMLSINRTLPGHIFYDGIAVRKVHQGDDGAWYVTTHSFGNNHQFHTAEINNLFGPGIFDDLDQEMQDNIEVHH